MHGLLSGQESRQQLYTMLTRGRAANHLYLQVVGDGDPHTVIRPETVTPRTPTEILHQILACDDTPASATSLLREHSDPAARLYVTPSGATPTAFRWPPSSSSDPRSFRCSTPEPTRSCPTSPTSRRGRRCGHTCSPWRPRPVSIHSSTCTQRPPVENSTQQTWQQSWTGASQSRQPPTQGRWLPGIPQALHDHPGWDQYLAKRSRLVTDLADQVRGHAGLDETQPVWAPPGSRPNLTIIGEIAVGGPPTASTPTTHDQPEQHSCPQLRPSGNTTSTEVSPGAVTTTTVLTSQSPRLLQPRVVADTKIDSACPNH